MASILTSNSISVPTPVIRHYGPLSQLQGKSGHWVLDGLDVGRSTFKPPDPRLPLGARRFWVRAGLPTCHGGVVAWWGPDRVPVGFCRYWIDSPISPQNPTLSQVRDLSMVGTWVDPRFRRAGLTLAMWRRVFRHLRAGTLVSVTTISKPGFKMVQSLERAFPKLRFSIW